MKNKLPDKIFSDKKFSRASKKGFVKEILLVVIAIIILSYLGINIKDILDSESVKNNFLYVWELLVSIWNNYIAGAFIKIFSFIISLVRGS